MLPLPWPDINWLISFDNELLFTLRKLPRGNYGILKLNSEEDPFITFKDCEGGTDPLFTASPSSEMLGQFLWKIQPQQHSFDNSEAEASQTPPPHCPPVPPTSVPAEPPPPAQCRPSCLRLLQLLSLPGLHCSSFSSSQRRVLNLRRGEYCGLTAGISDVSLPTSRLVTSLPRPCPAFSQPELRHSPGPHTPHTCQAQASSSSGKGGIKTIWNFILSAAFTGLLRLTTAAAVFVNVNLISW